MDVGAAVDSLEVAAPVPAVAVPAIHEKEPALVEVVLHRLNGLGVACARKGVIVSVIPCIRDVRRQIDGKAVEQVDIVLLHREEGTPREEERLGPCLSRQGSIGPQFVKVVLEFALIADRNAADHYIFELVLSAYTGIEVVRRLGIPAVAVVIGDHRRRIVVFIRIAEEHHKTEMPVSEMQGSSRLIQALDEVADQDRAVSGDVRHVDDGHIEPHSLGPVRSQRIYHRATVNSLARYEQDIGLGVPAFHEVLASRHTSGSRRRNRVRDEVIARQDFGASPGERPGVDTRRPRGPLERESDFNLGRLGNIILSPEKRYALVPYIGGLDQNEGQWAPGCGHPSLYCRALGHGKAHHARLGDIDR